jgi:RNA-directed DNA polymerase
LKDKLKLTINLEKCGIRKPIQFTILGFLFASTFQKGIKGRYQLTVVDKAWAKLKQSLKEVTRKTAPKSFEERIHKINGPSLKGEQAE